MRRITFAEYLRNGACIALTCLALVLATTARAHAAAQLSGAGPVDIGLRGHYFVSEAPPPAKAGDIDAWLRQARPVARPSMLGGRYWLYTDVYVAGEQHDWVFDVGNTLVASIDAWVFGPDGKVQTIHTGYDAPRTYTLHYGQPVAFAQAGAYRVLVNFDSPYFRAYPSFKLWPQATYGEHVLLRNVIALGCFGALLALAVFNLFVFLAMRDRAQLYYAAYLLAYAAGWAFVFNVPRDVFGTQGLHWIYVPFFLLPVLNTLFYLRFLNLAEYSPRLARWSRINLVLPLVLLPSCFVALSYAHTLATIVISIWLALALASGIACLRAGYLPARYFVLAFVALIVPALLILPANLGLAPELVDNELMTLIGGTADGVLLAFALADRYRLLARQKDEYVARLDAALRLATTDGLTGVGNRHAFDDYLRHHVVLGQEAGEEEHVMALIDMDGLKHVNDHFGHTVGDRLLRNLAQFLNERVAPLGRVFRLGGDEFAVLTRQAHVASIEAALVEAEREIVQRTCPQAGLSYGFARAGEAATTGVLMTLADTRMYLRKGERRQARARSA
ncbi:7TM diverse intracellular signaling domain-containing protein [Uliginosibacterium sp. sgz301328]|uniref:7TM diverse intracellular signaling domain-containing protein n=1 Tax=Uliginosibacterium sp. sgz301328 TaxID=3243764 RepID=UPI00359DFF8B